MRVHHLTLAVRGRRALARDETERRALLRKLTRVGAEQLLLFCLVDDHLHAVLRTDRPGFAADGLRRVLRARRPDLALKPPHLEPVGTRAYLRSLVGYVLRQPARHSIGATPALWTGSCFQDLAGARLLPGFSAQPLRSELPRLRMRDLFQSVGLSSTPLLPATDEHMARAGVARLVDLAAGVHALESTMAGNSPESVAGRTLVACIVRSVGLPLRTAARFLGVTQRSVQRLSNRSVSPRAVAALRRRLALEERVLQARRRSA